MTPGANAQTITSALAARSSTAWRPSGTARFSCSPSLSALIECHCTESSAPPSPALGMLGLRTWSGWTDDSTRITVAP